MPQHHSHQIVSLPIKHFKIPCRAIDAYDARVNEKLGIPEAYDILTYTYEGILA